MFTTSRKAPDKIAARWRTMRSGPALFEGQQEYVLYNDYAALSAERAALKARAEAAEAKLKEAVDTANQAIDVIASVQSYKQPDDPWEENALTMCEHEVFDFDVETSRAFLARHQKETDT
jgi:hypothetical protein